MMKSLETLLYEKQKWGYLARQEEKTRGRWGWRFAMDVTEDMQASTSLHLGDLSNPRRADYHHLLPNLPLPFLTLRGMGPFCQAAWTNMH